VNNWRIVYGSNSGIEKKALNRLYAIVTEYVNEQLSCSSALEINDRDLSKYNLIFVGTKESNGFLEGYGADVYTPEGYTIKVTKSAYNPENQMIIICGEDEVGTLYGCVDFKNKYLAREKNNHEHTDYFKKLFFTPFTEAEIFSAPAVKDRGLWTWGYVIYDYKGYIDNMVNLKLNTLTIWNDYPPVNAKDIVEYAHSVGIKIIWGYSWLWDTDCNAIDISNLEAQMQSVIDTYETKYAHLGGDGIYFQSFTETNEEYNGGMVIAEVVTDWVNKISAEIWKKFPDLKLQFGLHATSVKNRLEYIKKLNPDITIVWEDCGSFPYHYIPMKIEDMEATADLTSKVMDVNTAEDKFGVVLKGLSCLNWSTFVHQDGEFVLGECSEAYVAKKAEEKRELWRYIQSYWIRNAEHAHRIIKQMKDAKGGKLMISGLVEDGVFDKNLWYPVAVFAEMLWSTDDDIKDIMCNVALMPDIVFA